jgi:hypothetical protein
MKDNGPRQYSAISNFAIVAVVLLAAKRLNIGREDGRGDVSIAATRLVNHTDTKVHIFRTEITVMNPR